MSKKHPIVAVTGSSGAGTTSVKVAFERIFQRAGVHPAIIEGDGFHRYDRKSMQEALQRAQAEGRTISHFGPEGNLFEELEAVIKEYATKGEGKRRWYVHNKKEALSLKRPAGSITPWEPLPKDTDLLFYEGLHGGLVTNQVNIANNVDLLIGVVPIINLEWIQKIHRDKKVRGYSAAAATQKILSRMHDYVHYIVPQFSRTDINFQRVPTVDTSNPFSAQEIPGNDQSFEVVHVRNPEKLNVDFNKLLGLLSGSFMSARDTLVIPALRRARAMELIVNPVIERFMNAKKEDESL
ncbi:MAG: phosphoribulokinase [Gammaproteobacteria bacterium]